MSRQPRRSYRCSRAAACCCSAPPLSYPPLGLFSSDTQSSSSYSLFCVAEDALPGDPEGLMGSTPPPHPPTMSRAAPLPHVLNPSPILECYPPALPLPAYRCREPRLHTRLPHHLDGPKTRLCGHLNGRTWSSRASRGRRTLRPSMNATSSDTRISRNCSSRSATASSPSQPRSTRTSTPTRRSRITKGRCWQK